MSVFKVTRKKVADGVIRTIKSKTYYGKFRDETGAWKRIKLFADKEASKHELQKRRTLAQQIRAGMVEPTMALGLEIPLEDHIQDYCRTVKDNRKKATSQWCNEQRSKLRLVFKKAKTFMVKDVTLEKIKKALETLKSNHAWSTRTWNHYVRALKAFFSWLHGGNRIGFNPIQKLETLDVHDADITRPRRAFTLPECRFLVSFLLEHKDSRRVINPPKVRGLLYALAFQSGLRAKELFSLTPANFDFENGAVTILGEDSKNSSKETIPLPGQLMQQIQELAAGRDKAKPLFKGAYHSSQAGKRLKKDMAKARLAYIKQGDTIEKQEARKKGDFLLWENHLGEFLDFHSFRSGFITALVEAGANIKMVQKLARHKDAETTLKHYAKITDRRDLAKIVATMPALLVTDTIQQGDQKGDQKQDQGDQKGDQNTVISRSQMILFDTQSQDGGLTQTQTGNEFTACFTEENYMRPVRFEPTTLGLGNRCSIP